MSHEETVKKQIEMGKLHDAKILSWKEDIEIKEQAKNLLSEIVEQQCSSSDVTDASTVIDVSKESLQECQNFTPEGYEKCASLVGNMSVVTASQLKEVLDAENAKERKMYRIVADNFDLSIKARMQTATHNNQSVHWTHQYAVQDRVPTPSILEETKPQCPVKDLQFSRLLPDKEVQASFRRDCSVLISRVLVKYFGPFKILFKDVIIHHLPHPYLEATSQKSNINCLGLEFFNSNIAGEMAQVMMKNQEKYVPMTKGGGSHQSDVQEPIFFDGDALTEERARNVQWMFKDGDSGVDRLEGLDPVHTDWHAKVKLYELEYKTFFNSSSAQEIGTSCASMNRTGKTNAKKGPHIEYNAFKDFHDREVEAHILASFMTHIGTQSLNDLPGSFQLPSETATATNKRQWLSDVLEEYMSKFIFDGRVDQDLSTVAEEVDRLHNNESNGYPCRSHDCDMIYKSHAWRVRHELKEHVDLCVPDTPPDEEKDSEGYFRCKARCGLVFKTKATMNRHVEKHHPDIQPMDVDESPGTPEDKSDDPLYNYHRGKLIFGLLMLDFSDALREGDGQRLMSLYRIALLFFNVNGCTKYFYTTLLLLVKLYAILPEGQAFRLIWNRFFNKHGWKGRNIPLDLRLEHLNNFLKACLKVLGANLKDKSAQRIAQSLESLERILDKVDVDCNWEAKVRSRTVKDPEETVTQIIEDLIQIKAFEQTPGRKGHPSFQKFAPSIPGKVDYGKLHQSMQEKINLWSNIYEC